MPSMRRFFTLFTLVLIPLLSTSVVAQNASDAKSSEMRERTKVVESESDLDDIRYQDGKGNERKEYVAQGYGHMRQGNTSNARNDFLGRDFAPYGVETYGPLRRKLEDKLNSPSWELDIELGTPKRIEINGEVYWYVVFEVANRNWRYKETTTDERVPITGPGGSDDEPATHAIESRQDTEAEGIPVETTIELFVELYNDDVHATPQREGVNSPNPDDLDSSTNEDARRTRGEDIRGEGNLDAADSEAARRLAEAKYANTRVAVNNISDPFILEEIAKREGFWVWRGGERQLLLESMSAFGRDIGLAHEMNPNRLDGPICLPSVTWIEGELGDDGEAASTPVLRYPGVFNNNYSFAGFFGEGDTLEHPDHPGREIELVKDPSHAMWGKIAPMEYRHGDTVDRFGRVLYNGNPGYLSALRSSGELLNGSGVREAVNEEMIGRLRHRPAYRTYDRDDRVLLNFDSGIPRDPTKMYTNDNYRISGLIVDQYDQVLHQKLVEERSLMARGARSDEEIGLGILRNADVNRYEEAVGINELLSFYGDVPGRGAIPVKAIDHKGRPITRRLLRYMVGDEISEGEWNIWASREPDAVTTTPSFPHTIQPGDFIVGKPKIKMGRTRNTLEAEVLRRGVNPVFDENNDKRVVDITVVDYETGRLYDPLVVSPSDFFRDPDGSFFTHRVAPVPSGVRLANGEEYVYAPLGKPANDASPVPAFSSNDAYGVWEDYIDPVSNKKIYLRDGNGEIVRDEFDRPQYLKAYEYEYLYLYEFDVEKQSDPDMDFERRLNERRNGIPTLGTFKMIEVECAFKDGKNLGPASYRTVQERWVYHPIAAQSDSPDAEPWVLETRTVGFTAEPISGTNRNTPKPDANEEDKSDRIVREFSQAADEYMEGVELRSVSMSQYDYDSYIAALNNGSSPNARDPKYYEDAPNEIQATGTLPATYSRWTFAPPIVEVEGRGSDASVNVFTEVALPIWQDYRTGEYARSHLHYVSKRFGAFIWKEEMKDWDYMNVQVRGLRSPYKREGLRTTTVTMPAIASEGSSPEEVDRKISLPNYARQDWIYLKRFRRLGDEFQVEQDLVEEERALWYLRMLRPTDE